MAMLAEDSDGNMEHWDALMMRRVWLLLRMSNHVCCDNKKYVRDTQLRVSRTCHHVSARTFRQYCYE